MTKYATDSLAPSFATVSQVAANIPTGYWIIFAFTLVLLVIGLFIAWSIHQMSNKKSDHRRRMAKGCLIFFALLGLGVTVASIFLFITSVGMSTACAALPTILESRENSAGSTLSKWGFPLSDIGSSMLNICVSSDGNGDLASMFPATATSAAQMALQYIDGVVAFRNIQSNLTNSNTTSPAIQLTVNRWQMYQLGYLFDQQVAETQRKTLNHMVSCGSQSFQFSSQNCTSTSCVGIRETSNPIVTSCAPPAASTILANLQQYMSQEITLLTTMINALNSTNTQTPNSAQVTSRMAFFQTVPDFTSITNMAGSFLVDLPSMTGSFLDNTNCTALRTQLLALEEKICFSFNNYLYYFTCMAIFCAFFTLVVSWLLCGGLFVVGERVEILVGTLPAEIKSELKLISEGPIEVDSNPLY
jgi:hypothetical protein